MNIERSPRRESWIMRESDSLTLRPSCCADADSGPVLICRERTTVTIVILVSAGLHCGKLGGVKLISISTLETDLFLRRRKLFSSNINILKFGKVPLVSHSGLVTMLQLSPHNCHRALNKISTALHCGLHQHQPPLTIMIKSERVRTLVKDIPLGFQG